MFLQIFFTRKNRITDRTYLKVQSCIYLFIHFDFFLIGIHSMQAWTATTRYGVTRKRSIKKIKVNKKSV